MAALEAAYKHGEEWQAQGMDYIAGNFRYLREYVTQHLPQIDVIEPEGTYLRVAGLPQAGSGQSRPGAVDVGRGPRLS
ncbi:MAG: hypothetical protein V9H69_16035 [Anaerolineae bacterium]